VGDSALAYGLLGWSQAESDSSIGSGPDFSGWVLGAGAELMLMPQIAGKLEYRASLYEAETVAGVRIEPVQHAVMLGLAWRFSLAGMGQ